MVVNAWILPRGAGFWVVVQTEHMLFYLSDPTLDPGGFALQGEGETFWVTTASDASIQFSSKQEAERYLTTTCRFQREKQRSEMRGWRSQRHEARDRVFVN